MRAVKSIILAAGVLKRKYAEMEESKLVLRAITDCNVPKFINEDINLFGGIIQDLFPTTDKRKEQYGNLEKMIAQSINSCNLQLNAEFQTKTIQLYETVQVRHGLMLVGGAMGGKTQITNTLADALSRISKQEFLADKQDHEDYNSLVKQTNQKLGCPQVRVYRMNPKSVSIGQLYGDFEKVTRDWHDGILATTVKNAVNDKVGDTHWIMLDGPVDAVWIENLNTVLDDNKKLCLISGEIVKLTDDIKMMFEVEDLLEASPATVSRCGMVYVSPEKLGWQVLLYSWVNQLPDDLKKFGVQEMYVEMVETILPEVMDFLFGKNQSSEEDLRLQSLKPIVTTSKIWQFRSFLNLFESLLLNGETKASLLSKKKEAEETARIKAKADLKVKSSTVSKQISDDSEAEQESEGRKLIQAYFDVVEPSQINHIIQAFIMALIWGFGAPLLVTARDNYSHFIQKILRTKFLDSCDFKFKKRVKLESFPHQEQNLFNVFYNLDLKMWLEWDHDIEKYDICGDIAADNKPSGNQSDDSDGKVTSPRSTARIDMDDLTKIEYLNLNIVTQDTLKHMYLLEKLISHDFPIVMLGATGTGKTQVIKKFLSRLTQQKGKWEIGEMVLSATTTANQVQEYTFSRLEKHKKGVYGPKNPNASLIIFIDDLNMPAKEKYGAQPSLEMMRQIIDTGGFYRGKENQLMSVIKQMFICAMGLPGGGRSLPTMRLLRHFNLLHVPELSKPTMKRIFTKILEWGLEKHHQTWKKNISTITDLTIECYQRAVKSLLPTPAKSHYLFNLRQVSEIIQGVLFLDTATVEKQQDKLGSLKRLWVHECMRVFSDRLISDDDKKMFVQKCLDEQNSTFIDLSKMPDPQSIVFNNFVKFDPNNDPVYQELSSMTDMKSSLENILSLYNDSKSQKDRMDLLFFEYIIHHLSRTSRIIMKPQGNGLLIGLSGNGRQSVAKLAIYVNDSSQFSIEIHKNYGIPEWQEDLRNLFKTLGIDNKKTVFTFSDKDIKNEVFFEDIDSILNVGELTSLFNAEDLEEIQYEVEKQVKKSRVKLSPMDIFKRRCKKNLHLLLFMSPAGNGLQLYFRKYPSLVNCTSIDWYLAWPDQALMAVSEQYLRQARDVIYESQMFDDQTKQTKKQLHLDVIAENDEKDDKSDIGGRSGKHSEKPSGTPQEIGFEIQQDPDFQRIQSMHVKERVSIIMTKIHQEAILLAEEFQAKKRKHVYMTPLMFANMFKVFKKLLERKIKAIEVEMSKYQQGITKLEEAKVMIDEMQIQLERLKPVLEQKKKQVDATMKRLEKESKMVEAKREIVDKEAYQVKLQRDDADAIKAECKERLDIAEPYFQQAIAALKCLNASEFQVIKTFTSPPRGVKLALEACCIMLGLKGKIVKDANNQKTVDFWEVSKKMITNYKKLIEQLENYPKEDVNPSIIQKIQPYLANPEFAPEQIKKASEAAEGICKWVQAICKFDIVYKEITPKRIALAAANEKLKLVSQQLAEKQAELQLIIEQKMQLELEFKEQNQEKEELIHQRDEAQKKLNRASQLISSIGSEKDRWINTRAKLAEDKRTLLGDMILAAAIITYLGPFDGKFRTKALHERWRQVIRKYQIDFTANFSLKEVIANEEKVTDWLIKGLPNERVSVENMIIITECKDTQYPVLIDPQGQALKFLRQYNHLENFVQLKLTQPNATMLLTHALQDGSVVLVENAAEVTSPSLISILRRELSSSVGTSQLIKFNDNQVEFDQHFFCYICSQYSNPHFSPEVHQLAKVLDFSVTREGLEQQLLQIVCKSESAKEEDEREKLSKQGLLFTQQKKQIVNDILDTLRNSGKNILESDDLVNKLEASKQLTNEINHKLNVARHVEERIEENRKLFKPVAEHGARLYFAVQDLPLLDPMYQFSMKWFKDLFNSCFDSNEEEGKDEEDGSFIEHDSTPGSKPKRQRVSIKGRNDREPVKTKEQKIQRVFQLKTKFREVLYKNVCMSLFEMHKLLFAFFMTLKIFETGELSEHSFGEKLKALDRQAEDSQLSKFESSSKQSDETIKKVLGGRSSNKPPQSRQSTSIRGNDEINKIVQKEDERLKINEELLNYTLTGLLPIGMQIYANEPNPDPTVFSSEMWRDIETLTAFDCFETLLEEITKNLPAWTRFMKADQESIFDQLPEPYQSQLSYFAWIPLIRVLQPDMTTGAIRRYVIKSIGPYFVQPIIYQINEVYNESKVHTPMLLLLTPGNDPMEAIRKAAEEKGKVPYPISLGKGQGEKAKKLIQESKKYESWIVLQNCHLAASFLPDLEQIIENIQPQTGKVQIQDQQYNKKEKEEAPPHPGFRIWLTTMSIDTFPQSILHSSIKITSEPPKGIKASMLRQYAMINGNKTEKTSFEAHTQPEKWQPLFLALSFFHAVVRERRRFGPLGWTKLYDFNDSDFRISMRQLYIMVEEFDEVPFVALQYLTGDCNYGGRVTDDRDRIALAAILKDFYTENTYLQDEYFFAGESQKRYRIFRAEGIKDYLEYVKQLPDEESPELMGLHENANITQAIYEASQIFQNVIKLSTSSKQEVGGSTQDQCRTMVTEILLKIRDPFKIKEVEAMYPFSYEESMNSVLLQELARYNKLIEVVKGSLNTLLKTLEGKFVTTADIEALKASILSNSIPEKWQKVSYQSRKPLLSYVQDLQLRLQTQEKWIRNGKPNVFWISGFFFTQSFLTGVKQNFARSFKYPIDQIDFKFEILKQSDEERAHNQPPQFGCFLQGLFLEGASWNDQNGCLMESKRGEMHILMPIINFIPVLLESASEGEREQTFSYACPTYKTGERYGTLLTTGHSTNYVMNILLPSVSPPEHWVKRSVALLTQLDL